jgi:integrase/recombinase XerD
MAKRKPKKLPHIPPDAELRRIIAASSTQRDRLVLLLMYMAGLRVADVCRLELPDLDFATRMLFIREGKGGKDAYLPIPRHLFNDLRAWCASRHSGPVFPSPRGGRLTTRAVQLLVKRCAIAAGLFGATEPRRYHPHSFRHGFATGMMRKKTPMPVIQKAMRHESITTTAIYMHASPEDLREAMEG